MSRSRFFAGAWMLALFGAVAFAQTNTRVSVSSAGTQASAASIECAISADGGVVAFHGAAPDLVPGEANNVLHVFVHVRATGSTTRVSVGPGAVQGNGWSQFAAISADGRWIAFESLASNLVANDTNAVSDVFVHDRQTGVTERVSVDSSGAQANGESNLPSISADGRYVAFESLASNLVPGDTNAARDVFVHDRVTGAATRVSVSSAGAQALGLPSDSPAISADGRHVAFVSLASNLVAGDTNSTNDCFVHDRLTATTVRVSVGPNGAQANSYSLRPSISDDGRLIAFDSKATNLVPGDTNGETDAFVRDLVAGTTRRVSLSSAGAQTSGFESWYASISGDGRFVAFDSAASELVPNDTFGSYDVFVRDLQNATTERASVGFAGGQATGTSWNAVISRGGRYVAFESRATNLVPGDTNSTWDVFVRDRDGSTTAFCFGDGSLAACPCANTGATGRGCDTSGSGIPGALLTGDGTPSLSADSLSITASGEMPGLVRVVLQGDNAVAPVAFGDGLRCIGGALERLYVVHSSSDILVPGAGDPSISARSSALGDPIPPGGTRTYQVYFRDPDTIFCPAPRGGTFNVTNGLVVLWEA